MLRVWLADNKPANWTIGIRFVQFQKNTSHHAGIQREPYKALFGMDPKIGISTFPLHQESIDQLHTEEQLLRVFQQSPTASRSPNSVSPSASTNTPPPTSRNSLC